MRDRPFDHRLALASADPAWDSPSLPASAGMPPNGPYRGYLRLGGGAGARYAFFGGRTRWLQDGAAVCEGLLFEVSGALRADPRGYPSNGRAFRELSEAIVTDDPGLLAGLRAAYGG